MTLHPEFVWRGTPSRLAKLLNLLKPMLPAPINNPLLSWVDPICLSSNPVNAAISGNSLSDREKGLEAQRFCVGVRG